MARFGIIAAMPVEIEGFVREHGAREREQRGFYRLYECGVGANEVFLACSGIGKVNAAACTQQLIDCFGVDRIVNMGIAGGISPQLKTLDVVIGKDVFYHDFEAQFLDHYTPFRSRFSCDPELTRAAQAACGGLSDVERYSVGDIATGDILVESAQLKARIGETGAVCCEMEGAAVAQAAARNSVPFLVVRTISDLADEAAGLTYAEFELRAAEQSNRIVGAMLASLSAR